MMAIVDLLSFTPVLAVKTFGFAESTATTLLTAPFVTTGIGVVIGQPLADRLSHRVVLIATFFLAAVGVWALVVIDTTSRVAAWLFLSGIGLIGLGLQSRDKFSNAVAEPSAVGKSFGFYFTGLSLGAVVSPVLLGAIIDHLSLTTAFLFVDGFLTTAVAVFSVERPGGIGRGSIATRRADE
jgi:MFS family permease